MDCELLEVSGGGTSLTLRLQGRQIGAAEWREWNKMTLEIPATEKSKKAFYVGRRVILSLKVE
jgi:hypothetical protein